MPLQISASSLNLEDITYHPLNHDYMLDDNLPRLPHILKKRRKPPKAHLGALSRLPIELLHGIFSQLDIFTLVMLRRVNRRAGQVIDMLPPYAAIMKHASNALCGILAIGTGRWITCQALYDKLCTAQCDECGDFGGYLYLLTCSRVCFICLSQSEPYLPLSFRDAIRKFGVNNQILLTLPHMKCIPGRYSSRKLKVSKPLTLVDAQLARAAGIELHGSLTAMEEHVSNVLNEKLQAHSRKLTKAIPASHSCLPRRPRTEDKWDAKESNPLRYVSIVCVPALDRVSREVEWGFHCGGCHGHHKDRSRKWRRKYSLTSFIQHLEEYGEVRGRKHYRAT